MRITRKFIQAELYSYKITHRAICTETTGLYRNQHKPRKEYNVLYRKRAVICIFANCIEAEARSVGIFMKQINTIKYEEKRCLLSLSAFFLCLTIFTKFKGIVRRENRAGSLRPMVPFELFMTIVRIQSPMFLGTLKGLLSSQKSGWSI